MEPNQLHRYGQKPAKVLSMYLSSVTNQPVLGYLGFGLPCSGSRGSRDPDECWLNNLHSQSTVGGGLAGVAKNNTQATIGGGGGGGGTLGQGRPKVAGNSTQPLHRCMSQDPSRLAGRPGVPVDRFGPWQARTWVLGMTEGSPFHS